MSRKKQSIKLSSELLITGLHVTVNTYNLHRITGPIANRNDVNQPSDSYSRDWGMEQSSHDYASLHLAVPGSIPANAADLEKGGRYIVKVANPNQNPINNYAEINDPPTTTEKGAELVPTQHGYDVPKPQSKALQPPLSTTWGSAQGYETPEVAVGGLRKPLFKLQESRHSRNDDMDDEYVQPHLLSRRACDAVNAPVISSRKVSNESTPESPSTLPLPKERKPPKSPMAEVMRAYGSSDHLQKPPHQQQQHGPKYENIDQDGFIIGQGPPILSPVDSDVAKPKPCPVVPVKMELKKPAIPSKFFKPTAEVKQTKDANNSKERKCRFEPLTPMNTEKKSMTLYDQPKTARSQTWTRESNVNVNRKLKGASNYTPIDPTKMDPDNDYEPV